MSDEEKKAIKIVKEIQLKDLLDSWDAEENYDAIQVVLKLIETQQKQIESKKRVIKSQEEHIKNLQEYIKELGGEI